MRLVHYGRIVQDTSISVKILIPPAVLVLTLGIVVLLAVYGLNLQAAAINEVDEIALGRMTLIDEFTVLSEQIQSDVFRIAVLKFMELPSEQLEPVQARLDQGLSDLNVIYGQILTRWPLDPTERAILERMKGPMDEFRQQALQSADVVVDNPAFGALLVRSTTVPFTEFRQTLAEFRESQKAKIVWTRAAARQGAETVRAAIIVIALVIGLGGVLITWLIGTHLISGPIRTMTGLMGRLARGQLAIEVEDLDRRDEIGAMAQAVEVFRRNAVEKARLDEALHESQRMLSTLIGNLSGIVYRCRNDQYWTMEFISEGCLELTGYKPADLLHNTQRSYGEVIYPEDRDRVWAEVQRALANKEHFQLTYRITTATGHQKWVWEQGSGVFDSNGKVLGLEGYITDITERKQAEEALQEYSERLAEMVAERTQELRDTQEQLVRREKLAVLGQLSGGLAHQLRNPLGNIKNAGYLLNLTASKSEPTVKEALAVLETEINRAERIISSLLDFARTKAPIRSKVELDRLLREVVAQVVMPDTPRIELVVEPAGDLPPVLVDPDQLSQVFDNLIQNAIQAMVDGGRLEIKAGPAESGWVAVSVADSGVGIPPENMARVFEPLFTTKARGIGLGLALIQNLVEANGGCVRVESELGRGSTFMVELPVEGPGQRDRDRDK